jgi:hypothetical protein
LLYGRAGTLHTAGTLRAIKSEDLWEIDGIRAVKKLKNYRQKFLIEL